VGYEKYSEFKTPRLKGGFLPFSTLLALRLAYNVRNEHRHRQGVGVSTLRAKKAVGNDEWVNFHSSLTDTVATRMSKTTTMSKKEDKNKNCLPTLLLTNSRKQE
jgi:hypothetical protein